MKYLIAIIVSFVVVTPAFAAQIVTGVDPITGETLYRFVDEGANTMNMTQAWGLLGYETPAVKSGVDVVDEGGVKDTCYSWYPQGCFDLTKTDYYRNQMIEIARQHKVLGWYVTQFAYWYTQI